MRRRDFIRLLSGAAAAWPLAARAQQPTLPVIGYLDSSSISSDPGMSPNFRIFRQGLGEAGFIDGKNVVIDIRSANGQYDRLLGLAAELVRRQVAVITPNSPIAALVAKTATSTIPIVFNVGSDPVSDGLVGNLNRPGGNITGVTFFANVILSKRLDLLHKLVPDALVVAALINPDNANAERDLSEIESTARALGVQILVLRAASKSQIEAALGKAAQQGASALFVSADAFFNTVGRDSILAAAARQRIPVSFAIRAAAEAGALMSYGADLTEVYRQFGLYTARVLKGEKPGNLPIVQPSKFTFVVNLKAAEALGLTLNRDVLLIADEVIE